jgi:hypothetical protein
MAAIPFMHMKWALENHLKMIAAAMETSTVGLSQKSMMVFPTI